MKSFLKFIYTMFLTGIMTLLVLILASKIFNPKWVDHDGNRMTFIVKGFYKEKKNSLDVVITGNSDTYRGFSPMILYDKYGIASYNFVSAGQRAWTAYAMLEEVYRTQNPKVVLFNVDELYSDNQASIGNSSKVYDNMQFSSVKLKAVMDKGYKRRMLGRLSHFLTIFAYHDRYKELTKDDIKYTFFDYHNPTKGMDLVAFMEPYEGGNYMEYSENIFDIPEMTKVYLDKMVALSKENNTDFVLFTVPSPDSWNYEKHNAMEEYARENDLKFIDLNLVDSLDMDWQKDTADGGDHLNIYGAIKVSNYMADYLHENYDLKDIREDENYSLWKTQYEEYQKIIEEEIKYAENLN